MCKLQRLFSHTITFKPPFPAEKTCYSHLTDNKTDGKEVKWQVIQIQLASVDTQPLQLNVGLPATPISPLPVQVCCRV